jgi:hypothetical protein
MGMASLAMRAMSTIAECPPRTALSSPVSAPGSSPGFPAEERLDPDPGGMKANRTPLKYNP